jgi:murein L,D-transpeptidase YcbB/YkuD
VSLRQRLIITGDLDPAAGTSPVYDSYVEAGVRRFQARHGLNSTGAMNGPTLTAMNVPADVRLKQLELNAVRLRSYSGNLGNRYVVVNIPAALVETVENGVVHTRHAAGVGKIDRQSPIMNAKITEVNFNPFWTVPASIIKKDLIPKMQKEPTYLTDHKIRIFTQQGQELQPEQVNWYTDEATNYMFKQDPGDQNSLGNMKLSFHNPHQVYMHDTPAKNLFGSDYRFESSGCMRVQNVRELVSWVLRDQGYNRAAIDQTVRSGQRLDVDVPNGPAIFTVYFTGWTTGDGAVHFRNDIYGLDTQGQVAVAQDPSLIGSPVVQ